jgi:ABC-type transport system substrate-binding protein
MPSLDILNTNIQINDNTDDTVLQFMYRWLLRYSSREKKIIWSIANCGIETFPTIRCTISWDALWSDGTSITTDDIISTYAFFHDNARDEYTKSRLSLIEVQEDRGDIVFRFRDNDATLIEALFLPILQKQNILHFDTLRFQDYATSWPYSLSKIDQDQQIILLKQNPYFKATDMTQYFDQIRFGFGTTKKEINKIINADVLLSDLPFEINQANPYIRPSLYGVFLNSSSIPNSLRSAIFSDILTPLSQKNIINSSYYKTENNLFLWEIPAEISKWTEKALNKALAELGYYLGWEKPKESTAPILPTYDAHEETLVYINKPSNKNPIFSSMSTVEISWDVPKWTTKVLVNKYALKSFNSRTKHFTYTAKKEYKNLINGVNVYKVEFFSWAKPLWQESLTVYYNNDIAELEKMKTEWLKTFPTTSPETPIGNTSNKLEPDKLYKNGEPLTITIIVQNEVSFFQEMAQKVQEQLLTYGITSELIFLSENEIRENMKKQDFKYDFVFTRINLGLFYYNIKPFFHSSHIKNWENISKVRNPSLDTILDRISEHLYYHAPDKLRNYEISADKILNQEFLFFPLASQYGFIYVKDSVFGFNFPKFLPGHELLIDILSQAYLKKGYQQSSELKSIIGFFVWLKNELFTHI